ncbi:MAG TPA: M36 family metallopeptidase, partial [Actinomycetes bacterium]
LPDGIPPWSGMFLWEPINDAFEGPYSDGNFDQSVIQHEYSHGLSNRYVSAEDGALNSHQSGSMGEGWGDWYALNHLYHEGLQNKAVVGEFVTGNASRGIRNWSYDNSPTGFGDIGYDIVGAEVHADGEIWTTMLWTMRKALVAKYGEAQGGEIAARLVTDAMPLSPTDPSMLDERDAIIKALDNRYHARSDFDTLFDIVYGAFASRGAGVTAHTKGGDDTDPVPSFQHADSARNGRLVGKVVNASTGEPVAGARVMLGVLEARVSPVAKTSSTGQFAVPVTAGTYPVTIQAPGFGAQTFTGVAITAGGTKSLAFSMAPNLASKSNGAEVVSSTDPNATALIDDTEASSWKAKKGTGNTVVALAKQAKITAVRVSAFTSSRFEALKSFTLQTSTDGVVWKTQPIGKDAFSYEEPRPVVPDVHYKTFTLATPVTARYVRFWTDAPLGETKANVQAAELQVFSGTVKDVGPLPASPPDAPVTDQGTIAAGNPGSDSAIGVTAADFESTCTAPPSSQGADGWVTTLPDSFGDGVHKVTVKGTSDAPYDLDVYFYDASCKLIGSAASGSADESGTLPSGTKYVLSQLWLGAGVSVTVTATDTE